MKQWKIMVFLWLISIIINSSAQQDDSTPVKPDTTQQDSTQQNIHKSVKNPEAATILLRRQSEHKLPGMAPMRISDRQNSQKFKIDTNPFANPRDLLDYDAHNLPPAQNENGIIVNSADPSIFIPQLDLKPEDVHKPLPYEKYVLPTLQELDILSMLWDKGDLADTTIYLKLDSTYKTMEDVNHLLNQMRDKGMLSRQQISPANELTVGVLFLSTRVEMSQKYRLNRVYQYHCRVEKELMQKFIRTYASRVNEDSSMIQNPKLKAALGDSSLLDELDYRIHQVEKNKKVSF